MIGTREMKKSNKTGVEELSRDGQLVTFRLGGERYGIEILKIREVLHFREVTEIPNAPVFVEGIIELRDQVIPVVDMRRRLKIVADGEDIRKRIIILELGERSLGIIVDDISSILRLDPSRYESLPEAVEGNGGKDCISRLAKDEGDLIIVLSPERILTGLEREKLESFQESRG